MIITTGQRTDIPAFYTQGTVAIIGKWLEENCRDEVDMIIDLIVRHTLAHGRDDN